MGRCCRHVWRANIWHPLLSQFGYGRVDYFYRTIRSWNLCFGNRNSPEHHRTSAYGRLSGNSALIDSMADKRPLVIASGRNQQLQSTDSLITDGSVAFGTGSVATVQCAIQDALASG